MAIFPLMLQTGRNFSVQMTPLILGSSGITEATGGAYSFNGRISDYSADGTTTSENLTPSGVWTENNVPNGYGFSFTLTEMLISGGAVTATAKGIGKSGMIDQALAVSGYQKIVITEYDDASTPTKRFTYYAVQLGRGRTGNRGSHNATATFGSFARFDDTTGNELPNPTVEAL